MSEAWTPTVRPEALQALYDAHQAAVDAFMMLEPHEVERVGPDPRSAFAVEVSRQAVDRLWPSRAKGRG